MNAGQSDVQSPNTGGKEASNAYAIPVKTNVVLNFSVCKYFHDTVLFFLWFCQQIFSKDTTYLQHYNLHFCNLRSTDNIQSTYIDYGNFTVSFSAILLIFTGPWQTVFLPCGRCIMPTLMPEMRSGMPQSQTEYLGSQYNTGKLLITLCFSLGTVHLEGI